MLEQSLKEIHLEPEWLKPANYDHQQLITSSTVVPWQFQDSEGTMGLLIHLIIFAFECRLVLGGIDRADTSRLRAVFQGQ